MQRLLNQRYRVGPKIGDGGMAVVYQGFDTLLGRDVAIKVLRDAYAADPQFVARFAREAQAVAALNHPNIIHIFDVGVDAGQGRQFFVMEYIDGPNLKELIRARGPLPADEAVAIVTQVLAGLGYAHARGLVHRDVKPQNIMLTPDGTAKVTDFGIAKGIADSTLTEAGMGMGTVHYVSPEQARGEPVTPATDIYAAGVMLYEALTGALPFTGDSAVGVAMKHVHEAPLPPHRVNPDVPLALSYITLRALAKDPAARFASALVLGVAVANGPRGRPPRSARSAPPAQQRRAVAGPPPRRVAPPPRRSGGVGCVTWLAGLAVLLALAVVLFVGYRLSPFGALAAAPTPATVAALAPPPTDPPPTDPPPTSQATATATTAPVVAPGSPTRPAPTARPATPTMPPTATLTPTAALAQVPDLTGKTLEQARTAATTAGLTVEQVEARYSDQPAGQIITQTPAGGAQAARGSTITVVVSRGQQVVKVPDLGGQYYNQAASILDQNGLIAARKDAPSRTVPKGAIIDQSPEAGAGVAPGTTVTLTVSQGDVVTVPNLFGKQVDEALKMLAEAGFVVSLDGQTKARLEVENPNFFKVYPNVQDGQVISQSLPAGTVVERGAAITIAYYKAK
ncbi:MAG: protein kinase domain-containing protein [Thermomicrobiales bacterium]